MHEKSSLLAVFILIACRFSAVFQEICAGFEILEDTLVLRLEGGAEYYVPVYARYASQAFGTPLEQLSSKHGSQVLSCCCCRDMLSIVLSIVPCRPPCHVVAAMPCGPSCACLGGELWKMVYRYGVKGIDVSTREYNKEEKRTPPPPLFELKTC